MDNYIRQLKALSLETVVDKASKTRLSGLSRRQADG